MVDRELSNIASKEQRKGIFLGKIIPEIESRRKDLGNFCVTLRPRIGRDKVILFTEPFEGGPFFRESSESKYYLGVSKNGFFRFIVEPPKKDGFFDPYLYDRDYHDILSKMFDKFGGKSRHGVGEGLVRLEYSRDQYCGLSFYIGIPLPEARATVKIGCASTVFELFDEEGIAVVKKRIQKLEEERRA